VATVSDCLKNIDIFILAGGQGTRIRETLGDIPKLLAPIGKVPFLELLISRLKFFGARRVIISLGFLGSKVLHYLDVNPPSGVEIITEVEPEPLGTAGCIRYLRSHITTDPVMVINGDSFFTTDLCEFVLAHKIAGQEASILCAQVEDTARFGRLEISSDNRVERFYEKSSERSRPGIINAGGYLFSPNMLDTISQMSGQSLEKDVFEKLPSRELAAFIGKGMFIDIGTPEDLERAVSLLSPYI
jgi:mannose-1-phosphate guanylyltransferase